MCFDPTKHNGLTTCLKFLFQDDIKDPVNDRLTLAERNERLQNQLKSLKEDLVRDHP